MSARAWKCYRCNLLFRDEAVAKLHRTISHHNITLADIIEA
jgi:hypothetical protein